MQPLKDWILAVIVLGLAAVDIVYLVITVSTARLTKVSELLHDQREVRGFSIWRLYF